ncbi:MAG: PHP domain-containing protein [Dehalococcoidia bacterium]|jgi:predicted metal-dependent phosphoesterase TrpH|nr:PHP domain-containing protein [Dehalococcoidia bacterium]
MGSILDLHVHTTLGSWDSSLRPERLEDAMRRVGLTGVATTEHLRPWPHEEARRFQEETGLFLLAAREWETDMGHIISLGLPQEVQGIWRAEDLRKVADQYGALLIIAHPFRYFPGPSSLLFGNIRDAGRMTVEQLAQHPVFHLADAIEVLNGGCVEWENMMAYRVARYLGKPMVASSDAHSFTEVGRFATIFQAPIFTVKDLLRELRMGKCQPAVRRDGTLVPFTPEAD